MRESEFKKKHLSFWIIPEGSSKRMSLRLSYRKVWVILALFGLWILILIILTLLHGRAAFELLSGKTLRQENERLRQYNSKVVELERELQEYRRFVQRVADLAGIEHPLPASRQERETNLAVFREEASPFKERETGLYPSNAEIASKSPEGIYHAVEEDARVEPESLVCIPRGVPMEGWITKGFSLKEHVFGGEHTGMDFAAKEGTEVRVTADGMVMLAGWDDVYGNLIAVDHGGGYVTYYGHNSKILVNLGDIVKRGDVIALSGNSGRSSAPHLHYEIRKDSLPIDPKDFLNSR